MKYRKKPVVVEAEVYKRGMEDGFDNYCVWWDRANVDCPEDCDESVRDVCDAGRNLVKRPYINTLEGKHYINPGDYIITGVKGERYPCKPDIFEMTYEEVD